MEHPGLRALALAVLAVLLPAQGLAAQQAERRTALVIGNSTYKSTPLANSRNDGQDMAQALRELGFSVTLKVDAGTQEMLGAIRDFGNELVKGGVGLFYYAGHGMQGLDGRNYLIPVDADITAEDELRFFAIDAGLVLTKMESAGNPVNIVLLDACRDNPFRGSFRSATGGSP